MSRGGVELHPATPWLLRLFDRVPLPPLAVGGGIGLAGFGVFLLYTAVFEPAVGRIAGIRAENIWIAELILTFLNGLVLAATAISVRGADRDLAQLRPALRATEADFARLRASLRTYPRAALALAGLIGSAGATVATLPVAVESWTWGTGSVPALWDASALWLLGRNAVNFWLISRAAFLELYFAHAFSRLGERLGTGPVLERGPLAPFARRALRGVLTWMLLAAYFSLLYLGGWAADAAMLALLLIGLFAAAAFVLPVLGARRRIRAVKARELARVRHALGPLREALFPDAQAPRETALAPGRAADLIAYEERVERLLEWPFGATTVLRFALYVSIGLGSWIGAALVERLLESALR